MTPAQKACASCFTDLPWALATTESDQSGRIIIFEVAYVGALPNTLPTTTGALDVSDDRLAVVGARILDDLGEYAPADFTLPTDKITAATVEGPEQVEKRVTATRLFLVGIFAFAWKKSQKVSFLVVETKDGMALFECRSLTPLELRARLAAWLSRFTQLPDVEKKAADDAAERLRRVTAPLGRGVRVEARRDHR